MVRQRQVRIHALEPAVLRLEFLQAPQLRDIHPAVPRLPVVQRRFTHSILAGQLRHLHASFALLEHRDDLLFTEPGLLHSSSPGENSTPQWSCSSGGYTVSQCRGRWAVPSAAANTRATATNEG